MLGALRSRIDHSSLRHAFPACLVAHMVLVVDANLGDIGAVQAKMKEHYGVEDLSLLMVDIWSAGNYGE
eukprot:2479057-Pyramimonas_sp.AAC.4